MYIYNAAGDVLVGGSIISFPHQAFHLRRDFSIISHITKEPTHTRRGVGAQREERGEEQRHEGE
jgi:hypothetical protein